jgi:hypothetical protein
MCETAAGGACGAYCIDHNKRNPAGERALAARCSLLVASLRHRTSARAQLLMTQERCCCAETPNPTDPSKPNPSWRLPLTGLGPFGSTGK